MCRGTSNGLEVDETVVDKIAALSKRYKECQYVDGNLEITALNDTDFYNRDLSFLNSIREVSAVNKEINRERLVWKIVSTIAKGKLKVKVKRPWSFLSNYSKYFLLRCKISLFALLH